MFLTKPLFFLNAESAAGAGEGEVKDSSKEAGASKEEPPAWAEEKDALLKKHDKAFKKARLLEEENSDLKTKLQELSKEKPESDPAKLRESFQKREDELTTQLEIIQRERNDEIKHNAFLKNAGLFVDKSVDQVWKLIQDDLDVEIEDGKRTVVVKSSHLSVAEYLKKFADDNEHLAKAKGRAGSGSEGAGKGNGKATTLPANFDSLSQGDQTQWFRDHPEVKL